MYKKRKLERAFARYAGRHFNGKGYCDIFSIEYNFIEGESNPYTRVLMTISGRCGIEGGSNKNFEIKTYEVNANASFLAGILSTKL